MNDKHVTCKFKCKYENEHHWEENEKTREGLYPLQYIACILTSKSFISPQAGIKKSAEFINYKTKFIDMVVCVPKCSSLNKEILKPKFRLKETMICFHKNVS